jgi:magnesium-transporting ATPase (P-type)
MYFNGILPNISVGAKSLMKSLASNWTRRRWLDFRNGHSIYLIFLMTFANFVTIQYGLLIDQVPYLKSLFESIWIFAVIFVSAYVPIAIVIGYWHRKTQWRVEQQALFKENEIGATMWLFVIDLIDGKISEEEKQQMRDMLHKIVRKPPRPTEQTEKQKQDPIDRPTDGNISDYKEPRIEQGQK